jgi:imidazolonepropionase-like amidohydrolase
MMADQGIFLTSTLSSNFWMINAQTRNGIPQFMFEKAEEIATIRRENLRRALDMGVRVVMGTDAGTPYNYHGKNAMELVQYVREGIMDEKESVIASTRSAADAIGMLDCLGTLEKGKYADCLVLKKDPLKDITCLQDLEALSLVFKEGSLIRGEIDVNQWSAETLLGLG